MKSTEDCWLHENYWKKICPDLDTELCFKISEAIRLTALTIVDFVCNACPAEFNGKLSGVFKPAASILNSSRSYAEAYANRILSASFKTYSTHTIEFTGKAPEELNIAGLSDVN